MFVDPTHYTDALESIGGLDLEASGYSPERCQRAAYEVAYFYTYGELPDDHYVIEKIEQYDGGDLIIHCDWRGDA